MSNLRILLSEGEHPPARPFLLQPPPAARLPARDPAASSAALRPTAGCSSPRHARRRVTWTGPAGRCSCAARPRMARLRPPSRPQAGSTRARRAGCPPRPNLARRGGASAPPRPLWRCAPAPPCARSRSRPRRPAHRASTPASLAHPARAHRPRLRVGRCRPHAPCAPCALPAAVSAAARPRACPHCVPQRRPPF